MQALQRLRHKILRTSSVLSSCLDVATKLEEHCNTFDRLGFTPINEKIRLAICTYTENIKVQQQNVKVTMEALQGTFDLVAWALTPQPYCSEGANILWPAVKDNRVPQYRKSTVGCRNLREAYGISQRSYITHPQWELRRCYYCCSHPQGCKSYEGFNHDGHCPPSGITNSGLFSLFE